MGKCKDCVVGLFGSCGRNAEYCRLERETLMDEARLLSRRHGHTLGEFVQMKGYSIWQANCTQCGQSTLIDIDPEVDAPTVYGKATIYRCPERSTELDSVVESDANAKSDLPPWDRPLHVG